MSIRSRFRIGEVSLALLAIVAIVGIGLYTAPAKQAGQQSSTGWSKPGASTGSLLRTLSPLIPPIFGPNVRANSDATQFGQHEPGLAVSRVHTNTVVVASKDYRDANVKHVWFETSTDGGVTWPTNRQFLMPGINLTTYPIQSDPVVMARDDGRIYVACLATNTGTSNGAVYITWTDDDGATWLNPSVRISPADPSLDDKDWFAIDNNPASPYYHRMYMMYAPGAGYVAEQHSTDGGLTWTPRQTIGANSTEYTYPVVGSDGTVYNFMMLNWGGGQTGTVQLTKSTNGGVNWSAPTTVSTANQPPSTIPRSSVRFFAIISAAVDPNNGNLYAAWTDYQNSATHGMDVVYVKSTNGGATWSSRTLLGSTGTRECSLCDNITPMVVVGADSKLHAFWLDRTFDPAHNLFDSWYSSSTDGGTTWDPDTRVSTQSQDLSLGLPPGSGGAAGDYWGLDTTQDTIYVAWNDTRSGVDQDIYVAKGLMSQGGGGTPSPTVAASNTPTRTSTPVATVASATSTPPGVPSASATSTVAPSATPNPSESPTETSTPGASATFTASPSPTSLAECILEQHFEDVLPNNVFYQHIQTLFCHGLINGYPCGGPGEPCGTGNRPYFRTNNNVTRGQLSKIVSGAAGFNEPVSGQSFEDIAPGSTFYVYIERLYTRGIISGYPCGSPGEPCVPPGNRPYFRPNNNSTRGQISKIVSNAAGFNDPPGAQIFEDVPPGSTFYDFIQRLASRGVMQGYPCGQLPGEPCVPPENRPYFRPNFNATRGQTSKIVVNTFFP